MDTTARFLTIIGGIISILAVLMRMAWLMGKAVQQMADHIALDEKIQADHEARIRAVERQKPRRQKAPWE